MANLPAVWALLRAPFNTSKRLDDRTLCNRARSGDADAFRHLFDRHAPSVHRFLYDLTGDDSLADEATQETFVRAFQKLSSLRDEDRLAPWLFGIGRFVCLEAFKARVRHAEAPLDAHLEAPQHVSTETPETTLLSRERGVALNVALLKLREDRRAALILRADHGLPYEEIARTLGWSLAKTKVELHRARAQLRELLARAEAA